MACVGVTWFVGDDDGYRLVVVVDIYSWRLVLSVLFFFFNDTATTEIYTLSLHDALPISLFQEKNPVSYHHKFILFLF